MEDPKDKLQSILEKVAAELGVEFFGRKAKR
jgi:hypothetical protein